MGVCVLPHDCDDHVLSALPNISQALSDLLARLRDQSGSITLSGTGYAAWTRIPAVYRSQLGQFGSDTGTQLDLTREQAISLASQLHNIEIQARGYVGQCMAETLTCLSEEEQSERAWKNVFMVMTLVLALTILLMPSRTSQERGL